MYIYTVSFDLSTVADFKYLKKLCISLFRKFWPRETTSYKLSKLHIKVARQWKDISEKGKGRCGNDSQERQTIFLIFWYILLRGKDSSLNLAFFWKWMFVCVEIPEYRCNQIICSGNIPSEVWGMPISNGLIPSSTALDSIT